MPSVEVLPDGFRLERMFDSNGNVTQVVLKDTSSNVIYQANYTYNNGRLQTLSANNKTISYSYNALGNVSEINLNNASKIVYAYDGLGRMTSQAYKVGTNEIKKSLYNITSDNKIASIENRRLLRMVFKKILSFLLVGAVVCLHLYSLPQREKIAANSIFENFIDGLRLDSKIQFADVEWFYLKPKALQEGMSYFCLSKGDVDMFGDIQDGSSDLSFANPKIIKELFAEENAALCAAGSYPIKKGSLESSAIYNVFSLSSGKVVLILCF